MNGFTCSEHSVRIRGNGELFGYLGSKKRSAGNQP